MWLDQPKSVWPSEPIQTYLRIRPPSIDERDNRESSAPSYVEVLSDTQVMMHAPPEVSLSKSRLRTNPAAPVKYTFSHVFAPHLQEENNTSRSQVQADFFTMTTLPLCTGCVEGKEQSCLHIWCYQFRKNIHSARPFAKWRSWDPSSCFECHLQ